MKLEWPQTTTLTKRYAKITQSLKIKDVPEHILMELHLCREKVAKRDLYLARKWGIKDSSYIFNKNKIGSLRVERAIDTDTDGGDCMWEQLKLFL